MAAAGVLGRASIRVGDQARQPAADRRSALPYDRATTGAWVPRDGLRYLFRPDSEVDEGLVTLLAAGAMGKTRLALEATERLGPRFDDGAVVVWLAGAATLDQVAPALAEALGLACGCAASWRWRGATSRPPAAAPTWRWP